MRKMSKLAYTIVFISLFVGLNHAAFVDILHKCSIKDNECQKQLFQDSLKKIDKTGVPELNIPPIDPIHIKNVTMSLMNLVNLTIVDGVVKGIKDCEFTKYKIDLEKGFGNQEVLCDVTIKGRFRVNAASPVIEGVFGGSEIRGNGNGKVKIEKFQLELNYPFGVVKKDDGEIYFECDYKKITKRFDILGKVSFAADKIYVGENDVSSLVVQYLNENWRFILKTFGKTFIDKASEFYNQFTKSFFDNVPAKYYILEDLTPYLKD